MMSIFADDLFDRIGKALIVLNVNQSDGTRLKDLIVDICVTKEPYHVDKAEAIARSETLDRSSSILDQKNFDNEPEQIHLLGYDSLIRLLDAKYYPPRHDLSALVPLFSKHRLRVTYRADSDWGSKAEQDGYLEALRRGDREFEDGNRDWAKKIEMVEGRTEGGIVISSTRVRQAAKDGDHRALNNLLTCGVTQYVMQEGLYQENE